MKIPDGGLLLGAAALLAVLAGSPGNDSRGADGGPASAFTIRADRFDRGNVRASRPGAEYADRHPCIWNAGRVPNRAEYDLDFPVTAEYTLSILYAAADSRPVDILLDGVRVHRGCAGVTGSWQTSTAAWEPQCRLRASAGRHTIALVCPGPCMPHICALRLESAVPFPDGWRLARSAPSPADPGAVRPFTPRAHRLLALALRPDFGAPEGPALAADVRPAGEDIPEGPAARDELLRTGTEGLPPETPWVARLRARLPGGGESTESLDLSPARLRSMLGHVLELIDDYRSMDGSGPALLEAERIEARTILAEADRIDAAPEGRPRWERFCSAYMAAYRLEARTVLANPRLDFDQLLFVRRKASSPSLGLPQNWQSNCALPREGFDDSIEILRPHASGGGTRTLFRPDPPRFVGDVDLDFDASRLLFSSVGARGRWQVFEVRADGTGLRQATPGVEPDVESYDACYLPDGRIIFSSTAAFAAVPCVNGSTLVANLYRMEPDGTGIRQLCFDQEHDWCPEVLPTGRILYQRWQYTDTPHAHDRILFHMNPDGTGQMEFWGASSYWPNSFFYARPIPGDPARVVGIAGGHHGVPRMGELVIVDPARGRREAGGVVARIPGRGKAVEPVIADNLVDASWPKFLHPWPLDGKYFLVSAQPAPDLPWGIYLVDVFDGMFLLREEPGWALLEPIPLRPRPRPPAIPDRTDPSRRDGLVYLADVYIGAGLAGVPRGEVKRLRLLSYHYLYPGMGGPQGVVGMEGPWDIKRILGTVPVEADGSAFFRVPACVPISVQPLDAEGKALQLMRSWFTAMPGEAVACAGCHEGGDLGPPSGRGTAPARPPSEIEPWRGPPRGFSFEREVQPVLDRRCAGCHDGRPRPDRGAIPDLGSRERIRDYTSVFHHGGADAGRFSVPYAELHRFVRRPGLESDLHALAPLEFHADTTLLVRMLRKGHGGVRLDAEDWDRLVTWIDLNAPFHGTWAEIAGEERVKGPAGRRRALARLYAGLDIDPEAIPPVPTRVEPERPEPEPPGDPGPSDLPGWPFGPDEARRRQEAAGLPARTVRLDDGVEMELVLVPAGSFLMGDAGRPGERPRAAVRIGRPFWMGRCEVTNREYSVFDPLHGSRVESRHAMQFGVRGFHVDGPRQPVVRVSWLRAMDFCAWLGARTGMRFSLPTEAQWEYACRAGSAADFWWGGPEKDFSPLANLADITLREFVCDPYRKDRVPFPDPGRYDDWIPRDGRFRDGGLVSEDVGRRAPNAWGLADLHGNVAEWTLSAPRSYPYRDDDGRNDPSSGEARVVRGGSWSDRPGDARASSRLAYRPYQGVFDVGFRVVAEAVGPEHEAARAPETGSNRSCGRGPSAP
jgi:formylglycine-generating enzyme required for sulfatase activity